MNYNLETHLEGFLSQAYDSLDFTPGMLREKYPNLKPELTIRPRNRDQLFFHTAKGFRLSFLVGRKGTCEASYISLDIYRRHELIRQIIHYCNRHFTYNYLFKAWAFKEGVIELKVYGYSVLFVLSKTYSIPEFVKDL